MMVQQFPVQSVYQQPPPPPPVMVQQFPGRAVYQQQQLNTQQLQQQQEPPGTQFYQPNNVNQSQACSIQGINVASRQCSTQFEVLKTLENHSYQSMENMYDLIPVDQVK